jgi:hypothetical protein
VKARKLNAGSPWWITLDNQTEDQLQRWVKDSPRIEKTRTSQKCIAGGVLTPSDFVVV